MERLSNWMKEAEDNTYKNTVLEKTYISTQKPSNN